MRDKDCTPTPLQRESFRIAEREQWYQEAVAETWNHRPPLIPNGRLVTDYRTLNELTPFRVACDTGEEFRTLSDDVIRSVVAGQASLPWRPGNQGQGSAFHQMEWTLPLPRTASDSRKSTGGR
jgi:hypothetical protein